MTWIDGDVVGELEHTPDRLEEPSGKGLRVAPGVQVWPPHVAHQERVAREDEPGFLGAAPTVGDDVSVVCRRVARRREGAHERVPELDHLAVPKRSVWEIDPGLRREVGGRPRSFNERRQA
jgi:hypothetical protein